MYLLPNEIEKEPEQAWYVLHGYPGKENVLRDNLRKRLAAAGLLDRLFDIIIPAQGQNPISLVKEGKVHTVYPTMFPGAVFVLMAMSDKAWQVIRQTPGLTGFVGSGSQPLAYLPDRKPGAHWQTEQEAGEKSPVQPGDIIRILSGPFYEFRAVVIQIDPEQSTLRALIEFSGRATPVELKFDQVKKL